MYLFVSLFMFIYALSEHGNPNAPLIFICASIFAVADAVDGVRRQFAHTIRSVNIEKEKTNE